MSAKKLIVLAYVQYILIALGTLLLFVRQLGGVLLTYALNPLVQRLEAWRIPRVVATVLDFRGSMEEKG